MGDSIHSFLWWSAVVSLALLLLTVVFLSLGAAADSGEFNGTWTANGTREVFPFAEDRQIYTFKFSGHVNLQSNIGKTRDFWSKCIGMTDTQSGMQARCVWEDLQGREIYLTLRSDRLQEDDHVTGEIVGGAGELAGISGDLSFAWSYVTFQRDGDLSTISGQALGLEGHYQIP